ncbi:hypothetical protein MN032_18435 [Agromyces atrinae]|uniref:hypothetical protein n=1 Tax=Agromyces atrinae TaxID=592376 RepID=UPI001F594753|nr:hypothetical protein [Agromyces atrinae]MCI2959666.1 hypothetical protein [Agromyces atrinae]
MTRLPRRSRLLAALTALAVVAGLSACAGSPTSSPENAARMFLEAMTADDFESASEVLAVEVTRIDDVDFTPVSNVEQEAMSTGVSAFEIVDLVQDDDTRATVRATLTGGEIGELKLSLTRGGSDGEQWLISRSEPPLTAIRLVVAEHWTATLAGGTEVAPSEAGEHLIAFPGSDFDGGEWTNDDGYFEPVPFADGFRSGDDRVSTRDVAEADSIVASAQLVSEAEAAVAAEFDEQLDAFQAAMATNAAFARIVEMPTATVERLLDDETTASGVVVLIDLDWGTVEECRRVAPSWNPFGAAELKLTTTLVNRNITDNFDRLTWVRYLPYAEPPISDDLLAFEPSDQPLSACGA